MNKLMNLIYDQYQKRMINNQNDIFVNVHDGQ
jgi:hypothetical protein